MSTYLQTWILSVWALLGSVRLYEVLPEPWFHCSFFVLYIPYIVYDIYGRITQPDILSGTSTLERTIQVLAKSAFLLYRWKETGGFMVAADLTHIGLLLVYIAIYVCGAFGSSVLDWVDSTVERITAKAPPVVDMSGVYKLADPRHPRHENRFFIGDISGRDQETLLTISERIAADTHRTLDFFEVLRAFFDKLEAYAVQPSQAPAKHLLAAHVFILEGKMTQISRDLVNINKKILEELRT